MNAKNILEFIESVTWNNNRDWFMEHKDWYLASYADFAGFIDEWITAMIPLAPNLKGLKGKDCIWRIYRDLRFEKNRMCPYKEWIGGWLAPGGKKSQNAGYYLHLQPGHCMFAAGMWDPNPELLKALRQDIFDNYDELETIMNEPTFKAHFPDFDVDYGMLKVAPAGYPRDWEHASWLRHKSYTVSWHLTDAEVCQPDFLEKLMELSRIAKPLNDFLDYTLEQMTE